MGSGKKDKRASSEPDERSPQEAAQARDAILKRMLQTKPKHQKDMMAERKADKGKMQPRK